MLNKNALISRFELANFLYENGASTLNDDTLDLVINAVSDRCIAYTRRNFKLEKVESYFDGEGNDTLFFPDFPVQAVHTLQQDINREFGSTSTINSDSFLLYADEGYVRLYNDEYVFSNGKQNVHTVYSAGFNMTEFTNYDTSFTFVVNSTTFNATFTATKFPSNQSFLNHVSAKLSAATSTVDVSYNNRKEKFVFTASGVNTFNLIESTSSYLFGFYSDQTGATSYTSEYQTPFFPADLRQSIVEQAAWWIKQSPGKGDGMLGMRQVSISDVSASVDQPILKILPQVKMIWDMHRLQL